jgi:hypothetical protein
MILTFAVIFETRNGVVNGVSELPDPEIFGEKSGVVGVPVLNHRWKI